MFNAIITEKNIHEISDFLKENVNDKILAINTDFFGEEVTLPFMGEVTNTSTSICIKNKHLRDNLFLFPNDIITTDEDHIQFITSRDLPYNVIRLNKLYSPDTFKIHLTTALLSRILAELSKEDDLRNLGRSIEIIRNLTSIVSDNINTNFINLNFAVKGNRYIDLSIDFKRFIIGEDDLMKIIWFNIEGSSEKHNLKELLKM